MHLRNNPGHDTGWEPTLGNGSTERDPEVLVGSKVNTSQQHALVAKVANSIPPSKSVTSKSSKVILLSLKM